MAFRFKNIVEIYEGKRIPAEVRRHDMYYYELRHGEPYWSLPLTVERAVWVNYWGTIVCRELVDLPEDYGDGARYMSLSRKNGEKLVEMAQEQEFKKSKRRTT